MRAAGVIVGLLLAGLLALLLLPRMKSTGGAVPQNLEKRRATRMDEQSGLGPPRPAQALTPPATSEAQIRDEFTQKRIPFFRFLRENYGREIAQFGVTESIDTLDLVVTRGDSESVQRLIGAAVTPTAEQYGFRRVRIYTANALGSPEPLKLIAEATTDGSGRWNTFLK